MPHRIEPVVVAEADRVDDERVAVPAARRVPHVARHGVLDGPAAVEENLAKHRVLFVQDHHDARRLDDLQRQRYRVQDRQAARLAVRNGIVDAAALETLLKQLRGPRLKQRLVGRNVGRHVDEVARERHVAFDRQSRLFRQRLGIGEPDAGEVRPPPRARRRAIEVDGAVGPARQRRVRHPRPLRLGRKRRQRRRARNEQPSSAALTALYSRCSSP